MSRSGSALQTRMRLKEEVEGKGMCDPFVHGSALSITISSLTTTNDLSSPGGKFPVRSLSPSVVAKNRMLCYTAISRYLDRFKHIYPFTTDDKRDLRLVIGRDHCASLAHGLDLQTVHIS
jgi:hypothetical protein